MFGSTLLLAIDLTILIPSYLKLELVKIEKYCSIRLMQTNVLLKSFEIQRNKISLIVEIYERLFAR